MLQLLDLSLTLLHLLIIGFNLLGWVWSAARKWHLISIIITACSWLLLGIWFGLGYCPITDWQWDVKSRLGEVNLPDSFIEYLLNNMLKMSVATSLIDALTAVGFALAAALSIYLNLADKKRRTILAD